MEKKWETVATIYAVLQVIKSLWELFSPDPLAKAALTMFNISTTSTAVEFLSKYALLIFSVAILLFIYVPVIKRKLFGMKIIIGQTFKNKTINLDGKEFIECVFENCTFRWNGERHSVQNCRIIGSKGVESQNPTIYNTIGFLKALGLLEKEFSDSWRYLPKEHFE